MEPSKGRDTLGREAGTLADTQAVTTDGQEDWHIQPHLKPFISSCPFLCPRRLVQLCSKSLEVEEEQAQAWRGDRQDLGIQGQQEGRRSEQSRLKGL